MRVLLVVVTFFMFWPFIAQAQTNIEESLMVLRELESKISLNYRMRHSVYYQAHTTLADEVVDKILMQEKNYLYSEIENVVSITEGDMQLIVDYNDKTCLLSRVDTTFDLQTWFSFDTLVSRAHKVEFIDGGTSVGIRLSFEHGLMDFSKVEFYFSDEKLQKTIAYYTKEFVYVNEKGERATAIPRLEVMYIPLTRSQYPKKRHVSDYVAFDKHQAISLRDKNYEFENHFYN